MAIKYWVADSPNAEINDTKAQRLATISAATAVSAADLDRLTTHHKVVTSVTALTAAGALAANTRYHLNDTDGAAYTLPAASASTAGDKIEVIYIAALANTEVHKFGTAGEFFANTSFVMNQTAVAAGLGYTIDVADGTGDDFLNLTGATNGGWGIGTKLTFIFNGTQWHVECWGANQGNGGSAADGAFATT
tara:strand:- start:65 stop:640 length:576 start_codon:yes stop_codon:yes gene_type:complete